MSCEERQRELASAGAARAARVFVELVGCAASAAPPVERSLRSGELAAHLQPAGAWPAAIFARLTGAVAGEAGILLARETLDEAAERLLGLPPKRVPRERMGGVLYELGNILISAAAGAIAELAQGVVFPSVPRVVQEPPPGPPDRREAWGAEVELAAPGGPLRLRFIWIPESR